MRVLHKILTYEFDSVEELEKEIKKEDSNGWDVRERGEIVKIAMTDKFYCTIHYRIKNH